MTDDLLAAAVEAIGAPPEMVQRSAAARAQADGVSIDDVLAAWSGGGGLPAPTAPPSPQIVPEAPAAEPTTPVASVPETEAEPAPVPAPEPVPATAVAVVSTEPEGSPVLAGRRESPLLLLVGAVGLFLVAALFAFLLPALDASSAERPRSGLSPVGLEGRKVYVTEGCWYCHTQQVRPIVTDANLGPVTQAELLAALEPDTLGIQRIGPDLAHAGSREPTNDAAWLRTWLTDPRSVREGTLQPGYGHLDDTELNALIQFLLESQ